MPGILSILLEMPVCQIYIPATAGSALPDRAEYPCNLFGRYKARVQSIVFVDQVGANSHRLIRIRSDAIKTPYGTSRDLLFCNLTNHTQPNPQGEWYVEIVANGTIDIELLSSIVYDGSAGNIFKFCILSLDVEALDN
jgi:hypothetical protein